MDRHLFLLDEAPAGRSGRFRRRRLQRRLEELHDFKYTVEAHALTVGGDLYADLIPCAGPCHGHEPNTGPRGAGRARHTDTARVNLAGCCLEQAAA
jgi:hypothetical protein